jgi:hypothetical protein
MTTGFLPPPVGRRSTVCTGQAKTKTFLREENQPNSQPPRASRWSAPGLETLRKETRVPIYPRPRSGSSFDEKMLGTGGKCRSKVRMSYLGKVEMSY